jgi:hypothetical protein
MVQSAFHPNGQRKRKNGQHTPEGQRSQIKHKLTHGIRGISPVLLGIEREQDWMDHYAGVRQSLKPGDEFEEDLCYLIAWQLWRMGRLIRHETELIGQKIINPDLTYSSGSLTREAIHEVLANPKAKLDQEHAKAEERVSRYAALGNGASGVVFAADEVREILEAVLAQVQDSEKSSGENVSDEEAAAEDEAPSIQVEEREWTVSEVVEQLKILAEAAGVHWRDPLHQVLLDKAQTVYDRRQALEEARRHVSRELVLSEKHVNRLGVYERQINCVLKSTYSMLERARAYRTGMPIPPPVSVDLTISKGSDAAGV